MKGKNQTTNPAANTAAAHHDSDWSDDPGENLRSLRCHLVSMSLPFIHSNQNSLDFSEMETDALSHQWAFVLKRLDGIVMQMQ